VALTEADVDGWLSASPLYCALICSIPTEANVNCPCVVPLAMGTIIPPLEYQKVVPLQQGVSLNNEDDFAELVAGVEVAVGVGAGG